MENEKRSNQGYEIIESCTVGSTEFVIGHNPRYQRECRMPYNNPPAPKQKSGDDRER